MRRSRQESEPSPILTRMLVGAQLRRLREQRGISRTEAGARIRASESKMSRLELGRVGCKPRDVADLLDHYGVPEPERSRLLARVQDSKAPGWWQPYTDVTPDWFRLYLGLEAGAALIRTYEVQFIPGLLQTEDYARAVIRLRYGSAGEEQVERRVRLRMRRQQLLGRPDRPKLWAVVDEGALRRPIGGRRVMRDQLEALIGVVTKVPDIRLQVVPLAAGGHAAAGGSFTILRFPHDDLPDMVYVEQLTSAVYLDRREDVDCHFDTMNRLGLEATTPECTVQTLERIIGDLDAAGR